MAPQRVVLALDDAPVVVFICQDRDHALLFLNAADRDLVGNVDDGWSRDNADWTGRRRITFCLEHSMYERSPHALPGSRATAR